MIHTKISRRRWIGSSSLALLGVMSGYGCRPGQNPDLSADRSSSTTKLPFRISLNTSTIRAYKLAVEKQIELVSDAGFNGIELWVSDVQAYLKEGGTCEALAEKLTSGNLVLENMIGFAPWFSEEPDLRKKGLEQLREEMLMTAKLGGAYIAAPVMGLEALDPARFPEYVQRFRDILDLSDETDVVPILELWGHGALSRLSDCTQIAIATGHPRASLLLDFYHLYRGGNSWDTLDLVNAGRLPVFHINDYPADPPREELKDADRVFPGDGICPFHDLIPKLYHAGFRGAFSIELFNQDYWNAMDVQTILRESYEKTRHVLETAMEGIA